MSGPAVTTDPKEAPKAKKCGARVSCVAMTRALAGSSYGAGRGGKGLSVCTIYNFKKAPFKPVFDLIVYKTSASDKGVCLNLCPWCGESLRPDLKRKAVREAHAARAAKKKERSK